MSRHDSRRKHIINHVGCSAGREWGRVLLPKQIHAPFAYSILRGLILSGGKYFATSVFVATVGSSCFITSPFGIVAL